MDTPKNELIVFIKAPVAGHVKTRLVPPLTYEQSAQLYRTWTQEIVADAKKLQGIQITVAYADHAEFPNPSWISPDQDYFLQPSGNLGEKLTHALERAFGSGRKKVVIIGSDSPGLPLSYITDAFNSLDQNDIALGPSDDGGYYLIGLKNKNQPKLFQKIDWSTDQVLCQTLAIASQQNLSVYQLPEYFDIDTFEDLKRYFAMTSKENPYVRTYRD